MDRTKTRPFANSMTNIEHAYLNTKRDLQKVIGDMAAEAARRQLKRFSFSRVAMSGLEERGETSFNNGRHWTTPVE